MCRETDSAFLQEFYQQMGRTSAVYIDQLTELLNDGDVIQRSILSQAVTTLTPDIGTAAAAEQRVSPGSDGGSRSHVSDSDYFILCRVVVLALQVIYGDLGPKLARNRKTMKIDYVGLSLEEPVLQATEAYA